MHMVALKVALCDDKHLTVAIEVTIDNEDS